MNWYKKIKITYKLMLGFLLMIVLMACIGLTGYRGINKVNEHLNNITTVRLPSLDYLLQVDRDLQQLLVAERSMIFADTKSEVFQQLKNEYYTNLKESDDRWLKFAQLPTFDKAKDQMADYEKARTEWLSLSNQVVEDRIADTREGRRIALDLTLRDAKDKFEAMRDHIDKLTDLTLNVAEENRKDANQTYISSLYSRFGILFIGIVA